MRIGRSESVGIYEGRKVWEVSKLKRLENLGRLEILGGYGGQKFLEVRSVGKFMRLGGWEIFVTIGWSGGLEGLGGR
jgi:hypothetical protein